MNILIKINSKITYLEEIFMRELESHLVLYKNILYHSLFNEYICLKDTIYDRRFENNLKYYKE